MDTKKEVPLTTRRLYGLNLRFLRKKHWGPGKTMGHADLSAVLHDRGFTVSRHALKSYEQGQAFPALDVAQAIADIYGTNVKAMLTGADEGKG